MVVASFRTPEGRPDRQATHTWSDPAPDAYVWMRGGGHFLQGVFTLTGTVNVQRVVVRATAPQAPARFANPPHRLNATTRLKDVTCPGGWPCWNVPTPQVSLPAQGNLFVSLEQLSDEQGSFGLAILRAVCAHPQGKAALPGRFSKGPQGRFAFVGLPHLYWDRTLYLNLFVFNALDLFASATQPAQPLVARQVLSVYFQLNQLMAQPWWDLTWHDPRAKR